MQLCMNPRASGVLQEYLKASGVPYTALRTSIFFDNFIAFFQYQNMCASPPDAGAMLKLRRCPASSRAHQTLGLRPRPPEALNGQGISSLTFGTVNSQHGKRYRMLCFAAFQSQCYHLAILPWCLSCTVWSWITYCPSKSPTEGMRRDTHTHTYAWQPGRWAVLDRGAEQRVRGV